MFRQRKVKENNKYPQTEGLWWEKDQNCKRKYRGQQKNNQTKENVLNHIKEIENNLKNWINTEIQLLSRKAQNSFTNS